MLIRGILPFSRCRLARPVEVLFWYHLIAIVALNVLPGAAFLAKDRIAVIIKSTKTFDDDVFSVSDVESGTIRGCVDLSLLP